MRGGGQGQGKGRGWGRGRGGGRGLRRFLQPVLLLRLHQGEGQGYSLLDSLDEFGLSGLDPSVIYRILRDMEDEGWVSSTWDEEQTQGPPRRIYRLNKEGREVLDLWAVELGQSKSRIERFLKVYRQSTAKGDSK